MKDQLIPMRGKTPEKQIGKSSANQHEDELLTFIAESCKTSNESSW